MCLKCTTSGIMSSHMQVKAAKVAAESYSGSLKRRDQQVTKSSVTCTFAWGVKVSSVTGMLTSSCNSDGIITED